MDLDEYIDLKKINPKNEIGNILLNEISLDQLLPKYEKALIISDDNPSNEYYLLRSLLNK